MNSNLTLHPKTASAGLAGSISILIVYLLGLAGVTIDPTAAAAIATVIAALGAYLAPVIEKKP